MPLEVYTENTSENPYLTITSNYTTQIDSQIVILQKHFENPLDRLTQLMQDKPEKITTSLVDQKQEEYLAMIIYYLESITSSSRKSLLLNTSL